MSRKNPYPEIKTSKLIKLFATAVIITLLLEGIVFLFRPVNAQQDYSFFYDDFSDKDLPQWHGAHRIISFAENDILLSVSDRQVATSEPFDIIWGGKTEPHLRIKNVVQNHLSQSSKLELVDYNTSRVLFTLTKSDLASISSEQDYDLSMYIFEDTQKVFIRITGELRIGEIEVYSPEVYYLDLLKQNYINQKLYVLEQAFKEESKTFTVPYGDNVFITVMGYLGDTYPITRAVTTYLQIVDLETHTTTTVQYDYANYSIDKTIYMKADISSFSGKTVRIILDAEEDDISEQIYESLTINWVLAVIEQHFSVGIQQNYINPLNFLKKDKEAFIDDSIFQLGRDKAGYLASYKIKNEQQIFYDYLSTNNITNDYYMYNAIWNNSLVIINNGYAYRKNTTLYEFEVKTSFLLNNSNVVAGIGFYGGLRTYEIGVGNLTVGYDEYDKEIHQATLLVYEDGKVIKNIPLKDLYITKNSITLSITSIKGLNNYKITVDNHDYFVKITSVNGHPGLFAKVLHPKEQSETTFYSLEASSRPITNRRLIISTHAEQPCKIVIYRSLVDYQTKKIFLEKIGEDNIIPDTKEIAIFQYNPLMLDYIHVFIEDPDNEVISTPVYINSIFISGIQPMNIWRPALDYYSINSQAVISENNLCLSGDEEDTEFIASYDFNIDQPGLLKIYAETQDDYPNTKIDVYVRKLNSGEIFKFIGTVYWTEHYIKQFFIHSLYLNLPKGDYEVRLEKNKDIRDLPIRIKSIGIFSLLSNANAVEDASGFNNKEGAWGLNFADNNDIAIQDDIFTEKYGYTLIYPKAVWKDTDGDGTTELYSDFETVDENSIIQSGENNIAIFKHKVKLPVNINLDNYPFLKITLRTLEENYLMFDNTNIAFKTYFHFTDGSLEATEIVSLTNDKVNCTEQVFTFDLKKLAGYYDEFYLPLLDYIIFESADFVMVKNIRFYQIYTSDKKPLQFNTQNYADYDAPFISDNSINFNIQNNYIPYIEDVDQPVSIYTDHNVYHRIVNFERPEFYYDSSDLPLFPDYIGENYQGEYSYLADPGENVLTYTTCLTSLKLYLKFSESILDIAEDKGITFDSVDGVKILTLEIKPYSSNVYDDMSGMIQDMILTIEFHPYNQSLTDNLGFLTFKFIFDDNADIGNNIKGLDSLTDTVGEPYYTKLKLRPWDEPSETSWYQSNLTMKYGRLNITSDDVVTLGIEFGQTTRLNDSYEDDTGGQVEEDRIKPEEKKFVMYVGNYDDFNHLLFYSDNDMPSFAKPYLKIYPTDIQYDISWFVSQIPEWYETRFNSDAVNPSLLQKNSIVLNNYPIQYNIYDKKYHTDNYGDILFLFDNMSLIRPIDNYKITAIQVSGDFVTGTFSLKNSDQEIMHYSLNRYNSTNLYFNLFSSQDITEYNLKIHKTLEHYNFINCPRMGIIDEIFLKGYSRYQSRHYSLIGDDISTSTDWIIGNLWRTDEDFDRLKDLSQVELSTFQGPEGLYYYLPNTPFNVEPIINPYNKDDNKDGIPDMLYSSPYFYLPEVYQTNLPLGLRNFWYQDQNGDTQPGNAFYYYNVYDNNKFYPTFTVGNPGYDGNIINYINSYRFNAPFIFAYPSFMNNNYFAKSGITNYCPNGEGGTIDYFSLNPLGFPINDFVLPDQYNPLPITLNPSILPNQFIFDMNINIKPWTVEELEEEGFFNPEYDVFKSPRLAFYNTIPVFLPSHGDHPKVLRFIVYYDSGNYYKDYYRNIEPNASDQYPDYDTVPYHPYYQVYLGRQRIGTFLNSFNLQLHLRVSVTLSDSNTFSYNFMLIHNGQGNYYSDPEEDTEPYLITINSIKDSNLTNGYADKEYDYSYERWWINDNVPSSPISFSLTENNMDCYTPEETYQETNYIKFEPEQYLISPIYTHSFNSLSANTLGFGINYKHITINNVDITPIQQAENNINPIDIQCFDDHDYTYDDEGILVKPSKSIFFSNWLSKLPDENFGMKFKWQPFLTKDDQKLYFFLNGSTTIAAAELKISSNNIEISLGKYNNITEDFIDYISAIYSFEQFDTLSSFNTILSYNDKTLTMWLWKEGESQEQGLKLTYGDGNLSLERVKFTLKNRDEFYTKLYSFDTTEFHYKLVDGLGTYMGEGSLGDYYLSYNTGYAFQLLGKVTLQKELKGTELNNPLAFSVNIFANEQTETYISIIGYNSTDQQHIITSVKIANMQLFTANFTDTLSPIYNAISDDTIPNEWFSLSLSTDSLTDINNNSICALFINAENIGYTYYYLNSSLLNYNNYILKIENKGYSITLDDIEWDERYYTFDNKKVDFETIVTDGYYNFIYEYGKEIVITVFGDGNGEVTVILNDSVSQTQTWVKANENNLDISPHNYVFRAEVLDTSHPIKISLNVKGSAYIRNIGINNQLYPESFLYVDRLSDYLTNKYSTIVDKGTAKDYYDEELFTNVLEFDGETNIKLLADNINKNIILEGVVKGQGIITIDNQIEILDVIDKSIWNTIFKIKIGTGTEKNSGNILTQTQDNTKIFTLTLTTEDEANQWKYISIDILNILLHTDVETQTIDLNNEINKIENVRYKINSIDLVEDKLNIKVTPGKDIPSIGQGEIYLTNLHLFVPIIGHPYEGAIVSNTYDITAQQLTTDPTFVWKKGYFNSQGEINLGKLYIHDNVTTSYITYDIVLYVTSLMGSRITLNLQTSGIFSIYMGNIILSQKQDFGDKETKIVFNPHSKNTMLLLHMTFPAVYNPKKVRISFYSDRNDAYISCDGQGNKVEWLVSSPFENDIDTPFLEFLKRTAVLETDVFSFDDEDESQSVLFEKTEDLNGIGYVSLLDNKIIPAVGEKIIATTNLLFDENINNVTLTFFKSEDMQTLYLLYDSNLIVYNDQPMYKEISIDENGTITIPIDINGLTRKKDGTSYIPEFANIQYALSPYDAPTVRYNTPTVGDQFSAYTPLKKTFINQRGFHTLTVVFNITDITELGFAAIFSPRLDTIRTVTSAEEQIVDYNKLIEKNTITFSNRLSPYKDFTAKQPIDKIPLNAYSIYKSKFFVDQFGYIHNYRVYFTGISSMTTLDSGKKWKDASGTIHEDPDQKTNWMFIAFQMNFALVIDKNTKQQLVQPFSFLIGKLLFYDWVNNEDYGEAVKEPKLYGFHATPLDEDGNPKTIEGFNDKLTVDEVTSPSETAKLTTIKTENDVKWTLQTDVLNSTLLLITTEQPDVSGKLIEKGLAKDLSVIQQTTQGDYKFNLSFDNIKDSVNTELIGNEPLTLVFYYESLNLNITCYKKQSASPLMFIQEQNTQTNETIDFYYNQQYSTLTVSDDDFSSKMTVFTQHDRYVVMDTKQLKIAVDNGYTNSYFNQSFVSKLQIETASMYSIPTEELYNKVATNLLDAFDQAMSVFKDIQLGGMDLPTDTFSLMLLDEIFGAQENDMSDSIDFTQFIIDILTFTTACYIQQIAEHEDTIIMQMKFGKMMWNGISHMFKTAWKALTSTVKILDVTESEDKKDDIYHLTYTDYLRFHHWFVRWWAVIVGTSRGIRSKDPYFHNSKRTGLVVDIGTMYSYVKNHYAPQVKQNLQNMKIIPRHIDGDDKPSEYLPLLSEKEMNKILYEASLHKDGYKLIDWITSEEYTPEHYKMNKKDAQFYYFWKLMSLQYGPYAIKVYTPQEAMDPNHEDFDDNYLVIAVPVDVDGPTIDYKWYVGLDKHFHTPSITKSKALIAIWSIMSNFGKAFAMFNPAESIGLTSFTISSYLSAILRAQAMVNGEKYWATRKISEFEYIAITEIIMNIIPGIDVLVDARDIALGEDEFTRIMGAFQLCIDLLALVNMGVNYFTQPVEEVLDEMTFAEKTYKILTKTFDALKTLIKDPIKALKNVLKFVEDATPLLLEKMLKKLSRIKEQQAMLSAFKKTVEWLFNVNFNPHILSTITNIAIIASEIIFAPLFFYTKILGLPLQVSMGMAQKIFHNVARAFSGLSEDQKVQFKQYVQGLREKGWKELKIRKYIFQILGDIYSNARATTPLADVISKVKGTFVRTLLTLPQAAYMIANTLQLEGDETYLSKMPNYQQNNDLKAELKSILEAHIKPKISWLFGVFIRFMGAISGHTLIGNIMKSIGKENNIKEFTINIDLNSLYSKFKDPEQFKEILLNSLGTLENELPKGAPLLEHIQNFLTNPASTTLDKSALASLMLYTTLKFVTECINEAIKEKENNELIKNEEDREILKIKMLAIEGLLDFHDIIEYDNTKREYSLNTKKLFALPTDETIKLLKKYNNHALKGGSDGAILSEIVALFIENKALSNIATDDKKGSTQFGNVKFRIRHKTADGNMIETDLNAEKFFDEYVNGHKQFGITWILNAFRNDLAKMHFDTDVIKAALTYFNFISALAGLSFDTMILRTDINYKKPILDELPTIIINGKAIKFTDNILYGVKLHEGIEEGNYVYYYHRGSGTLGDLVFKFEKDANNDLILKDVFKVVEGDTNLKKKEISEKDFVIIVNDASSKDYINRYTYILDAHTKNKNVDSFSVTRIPIFDFYNGEKIQDSSDIEGISYYSFRLPAIIDVDGGPTLALVLRDQNGNPIKIDGKYIYVDLMNMIFSKLNKEEFDKVVKDKEDKLKLENYLNPESDMCILKSDANLQDFFNLLGIKKKEEFRATLERGIMNFFALLVSKEIRDYIITNKIEINNIPRDIEDLQNIRLLKEYNLYINYFKPRENNKKALITVNNLELQKALEIIRKAINEINGEKTQIEEEEKERVLQTALHIALNIILFNHNYNSIFQKLTKNNSEKTSTTNNQNNNNYPDDIKVIDVLNRIQDLPIDEKIALLKTVETILVQNIEYIKYVIENMPQLAYKDGNEISTIGFKKLLNLCETYVDRSNTGAGFINQRILVNFGDHKTLSKGLQTDQEDINEYLLFATSNTGTTIGGIQHALVNVFTKQRIKVDSLNKLYNELKNEKYLDAQEEKILLEFFESNILKPYVKDVFETFVNKLLKILKIVANKKNTNEEFKVTIEIKKTINDKEITETKEINVMKYSSWTKTENLKILLSKIEDHINNGDKITLKDLLPLGDGAEKIPSPGSFNKDTTFVIHILYKIIEEVRKRPEYEYIRGIPLNELLTFVFPIITEILSEGKGGKGPNVVKLIGFDAGGNKFTFPAQAVYLPLGLKKTKNNQNNYYSNIFYQLYDYFLKYFSSKTLKTEDTKIWARINRILLACINKVEELSKNNSNFEFLEEKKLIKIPKEQIMKVQPKKNGKSFVSGDEASLTFTAIRMINEAYIDILHTIGYLSNKDILAIAKVQNNNNEDIQKKYAKIILSRLLRTDAFFKLDLEATQFKIFTNNDGTYQIELAKEETGITKPQKNNSLSINTEDSKSTNNVLDYILKDENTYSLHYGYNTVAILSVPNHDIGIFTAYDIIRYTNLLQQTKKLSKPYGYERALKIIKGGQTTLPYSKNYHVYIEKQLDLIRDGYSRIYFRTAQFYFQSLTKQTEKQYAQTRLNIGVIKESTKVSDDFYVSMLYDYFTIWKCFKEPFFNGA